VPASVEIRCLDPLRRDALEESARLALSFVAVASRPGFSLNWRDEGLRLTLSTAALHDGCYLPETALQLLEAVQAFGVKVVRLERDGDELVPEEWSQWWSSLPLGTEKSYQMVLDIL
jgi:hypothetical protein